MPVVVAAIKERAAGERRVALVPEVVSKLVKDGYKVVIEPGAGEAASHSDAAYKAAGATIATLAELLKSADVVACVRRPGAEVLGKLRKGQILLGLLDALADRAPLEKAAAGGGCPMSLDLLPRQLSRAQTMDALSSQASVAGYRAVIVAAETFDRYFPMMVTAAGTAKPALVLVLGAGVAGLQAIGTAKRLGAQVSGYDVRPASREEVKSMGAQFLNTSVDSAAGEGGYARELTKAEAAQQQKDLADQIVKFDIVITTAKVPGRKAPVLVTKDVVDAMKPGSVLVDLAASSTGGNVAGSEPGKTVKTKNGAVIVGADELAAGMPSGASAGYSRNIQALIVSITKDGALVLDDEDEVVAACLIRPATKGAAK
jgi:H+-translocating NAD(P) transhydrogenase subunit alpha